MARITVSDIARDRQESPQHIVGNGDEERAVVVGGDGVKLPFSAATCTQTRQPHVSSSAAFSGIFLSLVGDVHDVCLYAGRAVERHWGIDVCLCEICGNRMWFLFGMGLG